MTSVQVASAIKLNWVTQLLLLLLKGSERAVLELPSHRCGAPGGGEGRAKAVQDIDGVLRQSRGVTHGVRYSYAGRQLLLQGYFSPCMIGVDGSKDKLTWLSTGQRVTSSQAGRFSSSCSSNKRAWSIQSVDHCD